MPRPASQKILFEHTPAFGGATMIRRILGLAHVDDLKSIADP
jgi:5-methylthioribose kinase